MSLPPLRASCGSPHTRLLPKGYNGETGWVTSREGEKWFVVNLPALAEVGDVLGRKVGEALWRAGRLATVPLEV
jgi:hypothetical protein